MIWNNEQTHTANYLPFKIERRTILDRFTKVRETKLSYRLKINVSKNKWPRFNLDSRLGAKPRQAIYLYTYIYIYMYVNVYVHTYIHTHMHTCIHVYLYACIPTYIHTYIHTYIPALEWFVWYLSTATQSIQGAFCLRKSALAPLSLLYLL